MEKELLKPGEDYLLKLSDFDIPEVKAINCHNGMRTKCAHHGIDWMEFLENGIMASDLLKLNDWQVTRLVEIILDGKQKK